MRLELLGSLVLGACACLAVASPLHASPGEREDSEKAGLAGLALSFAITITNSLAMLVQQATNPTSTPIPNPLPLALPLTLALPLPLILPLTLALAPTLPLSR